MSPPRAGRLKRDRLDYGWGGASQWPAPERLLKARRMLCIETSEVLMTIAPSFAAPRSSRNSFSSSFFNTILQKSSKNCTEEF